MKATHSRLFGALLFAMVTAGCSAGGPEVQTDPRPTPAAGTTRGATDGSTAATPTTEELEALYRERTQQDRLSVSEADVAFMTGMIGHHAQALVMSRLAPENGANPEVRRLAARIINAQNDEIATMQEWLADRDRPVPEVAADGSTAMTHGPDHSMMPGMLTADQMNELRAARGSEFDRLYLTYMIQHHSGAVTMVHELFGSDGAAQDGLAFKLASDVQVDQITEIERMELMLKALSDGGTP